MKDELNPIEEQLIKYPVDGVTPAKFGELLGKSANAIEIMIKNNKLPYIEMRDPKKPQSRAEKLVYIPAYNEGLRKAYYSKPKPLVRAWLEWLGL
ncbi:MAG: Cox family DNA-binding protein [Klebsiella huaxiensis]|uniref:Cox family DNA-binding protein n=1 Tax=Klebsiella huaxiensis TaxID=2153354 RepID=UPI0026EFA4BC|nr:Cox family DNA-binding protein [Klebsiella huaxiensis]WEJ88452.1 MAG: Cox family DNA-binding protein [Klebsiella huaxiensis]